MADKFVFLDHVQHTDARDVHRNWNAIKGPNGVVELTVPTSRHLKDSIKDVKICGDRWRTKHLKSIEFAYKKAKYFNEVFPAIERILSAGHPTLSSLNEAIILDWVKRCGINTEIVWSSHMDGIEQYSKQALVIEICRELGATVYYSGDGARSYQTPADFHQSGIELVYQGFTAPEYAQLWGEFKPNLSALDYFMNNGFSIPEGWKAKKARIQK